MHGTTIHAHSEAGRANQPNELEQCGLIDQAYAILPDGERPITQSNQNNATRCNNATKLINHQVAQRFSLAAGERMQQNERHVFIEARHWIAGGKRNKGRPSNGRAELFRKLKVTLDRVCPSVHRCDMVIEKACPFASIAHSVKLSRPADAADQRTSQKTLEIKCDIWLQCTRPPYPRHQAGQHSESAKLTTGKNMDMPHAAIAAQDRH